jgi:hypothetical protein
MARHISRRALEEKPIEDLEAIMDSVPGTYDDETEQAATNLFEARQYAEMREVDRINKLPEL